MSSPRPATRVPAIAIAIAALLLQLPLVKAEPYGRDAPTAVGAFLDGTFPEKTPGGTGGWTVVDAFPGLTFLDPIKMKPGPSTVGGGNRLYVVGKEGQIWFFDRNPNTTTKTLFLDISDRVQITDNAGLVGLAFHPEFGQSGSPNRSYFYLWYYHHPTPFTVTNNDLPNPAYIRLSRFEVPDGSDLADATSEYVMIQQWDRHHWHNGGSLFFGNDGFLYASIGDEGSDFDPYDVGQRLDGGLLNGVLRIDVDMDLTRSHPIRRQPQPGGTPPAGLPASFSQGYTIPDDNPWLDPAGSILEEFWCTGLRSPHTMHYDAITGDIFVGDVGQGSREEIDQIVKGGNYGWPIREGDIAGPKPALPTYGGTAITEPLHAYGRSTGVCVICGPVYRGREHGAALGGKLLFADHEFRKLWAMDPAIGSSSVEFLTNMPAGGFHKNIASFGTDQDGEVYMVKLEGESNPGGKLFKLARTGENNPEPPALLSGTGVFVDIESLEPSPKLLPYALNSPFWSDGADKTRWVAIPNDGTHDTAAERVSYSAEGEWTWPVGTVFVKHFELFDQRVETRFMVHGTGGDWYGVTYKWRPDGSDADLLYSADIADISGPGATTQTWTYPGRGDCMTCHRPVAGFALGPKTRQLNGEMLYPDSACTANQLATWSHLGIFDSPPAEASLPGLLTSAPVDDLRHPVALRARSYLDSNCAYCHRPGGVQPDFDARLSSPLKTSNIINGALVGAFEPEGAAVVRAHDPARSILHHRTAALGELGMPPLAKGKVDPAGLRALTDWIHSLDPVANGIPGTQAEYFNNIDLTGLALTRVDDAIDFNWGTGSPASVIGRDTFSARWTGYIVPLYTETYTLHVLSNNGSRLWVDGQQLYDLWVNNLLIDESIEIDLEAGVPVPFVLEFFEAISTAEIHFEWSSPSQAHEVISGSSFAQTAAPDGPPIANNDHAGELSAAISIDVLTNDFDYQDNLDPTTVAIVTPPALGTATQDPATGTILYTPTGGAGPDSFTYTVSDTAGNVSNHSLVTLDVASHYLAWLAANFPAGGPDALPGADPDQDGRANAIEYTTGTDPADPNSRAPLTLQQTPAGAIEWEIPRAPGAEATLVITQSTDLATWSPAGAAVTTLVDQPDRLLLQIAPTASALYLRLEATPPQ